MTSSADVFLGVNSAALNQWIASLYAIEALRTSLFTGSTTQQIPSLGGSATVNWAVKQAPTVTLADPGSLWQQAIGPNGGAPTAVPNAFSVTLPAFYLSISINNGAPQTTTIPLTALVQATIADSVLSVTPLGVVVNLSGLPTNEQTVYQYIVVPQVLQIVHGMLGGYAIPQLTPLGVTLSPPSFALSNGSLLVAMNLGATSPAVPELDQPPTDPVFLLASPNAAQALVNAGAQQIANTTKSVSGSDSFTLGSASYNASVALGAVTVQVNPGNLTAMTAIVNASASASASATVVFTVGIGYDASVSPQPIPLSLNLSASGSNVLASLGPLPNMSVSLTPTGDLLQEVLSGIAWPLATIMVNLLQPALSDLVVANNPYTILTIAPSQQTISGTKIQIGIQVAAVQMYAGMLKIGGILQITQNNN